MTNRLGGEKSPYLQQHAHNPVDWYPWGEEAFALARERNVPIFLSIGYATCHWCHVMERESFEDEATAALMNRYFVNVKVDREERPDVDRIYMTYVQASTGSGGWPMSVWITPDLEPFLGGTYFPPQARPGAPGFPLLIERVHEAWKTEPDRIREGASRTLNAIAEAVARGPVDPDDSVSYDTDAEAGFEWFRKAFDAQRGGFGGPPKFPRVATFHFLLRHYARGGDAEAARMVLTTLREMARGGIWDHLGGGFHRYSVDAQWHVPHFEKMLYDQAQLATIYLEAAQLTGEGGLGEEGFGGEGLGGEGNGDDFPDVARAILEYVLRDMTDPDTGGFYSAEDADSLVAEGGEAKAEGAFYVWTDTELRARLGDDYALFADHYGVRPSGNASDPHGELLGKNVLHRARGLDKAAQIHKLEPDEVRTRLDHCHRTLLTVRNRRPRPLRDEKVLCAWNGMMISAFARGYQVLRDPRYLEAATRAARFVREALFDADRDRLLRRWCGGESAFDAYLEDYAHLATGLVDLYEAGFDEQWLRWAEALTDRAVALFHDGDHGGFFATAADDESLLLRLKDDYDGAEPSGNSVMVACLGRLAVALDRPDLRDLASATVRSFGATLRSQPHGLPQLLAAAGLVQRPTAQVVLAGDVGDAAFEALARAARGGYAPDQVLVHEDSPLVSAHVCRDAVCHEPTADPEVLLAQIAPVRLGVDGE
jgi:uncharacterized protein